MTKKEKFRKYIEKKNSQGLVRVSVFMTLDEKKLFKEFLKLETARKGFASSTLKKLIERAEQQSRTAQSGSEVNYEQT